MKKVVILIFSTVVFVMLLYLFKTKMDRKRYVIDHAITYQKNTLFNISTHLQFLVLDYGPYQKLEEIIEKVEDADDKLILIGKGYNPEDKVFYDNWGTPIELKIVSHDEYHLISAGPNKKFEKERGDDIMVKYDPLEELEKYNELIRKYESIEPNENSH